jgi:hypothetical protein
MHGTVCTIMGIFTIYREVDHGVRMMQFWFSTRSHILISMQNGHGTYEKFNHRMEGETSQNWKQEQFQWKHEPALSRERQEKEIHKYVEIITVRTGESKEERRQMESTARRPVYFLKKPPSWSIMLPLPLLLAGPP